MVFNIPNGCGAPGRLTLTGSTEEGVIRLFIMVPFPPKILQNFY